MAACLNGQCTNTAGSYHCGCAPGFELLNSSCKGAPSTTHTTFEFNHMWFCMSVGVYKSYCVSERLHLYQFALDSDWHMNDSLVLLVVTVIRSVWCFLINKCDSICGKGNYLNVEGFFYCSCQPGYNQGHDGVSCPDTHTYTHIAHYIFKDIMNLLW